MSDAPRIVVRPYLDISPNEARTIRAQALRFVLDCHAKKKAAGTSGGEDARKEIYGSGNPILHDQR